MGQTNKPMSHEDINLMPIEIFNLHIAVMQNNSSAIKLLGDCGIDPNAPWKNVKYPSVKDGSTPLCEAISLNHKAAFEILLKMKVDLNRTDAYGYAPIHKAAYHLRFELAKSLIEKGANLLQVDMEGDTPLHTCCKIGVIHPIALVVKMAKLFLNSKCGFKIINARNKKGKTPLHIAAEWGLPKLIITLIEYEGDLDALDISYRTPLHCCLETLLKFDTSSSRKINLPDYVNSIKALLVYGCDPLNLMDLFSCYHNRYDENNNPTIDGKGNDPVNQFCAFAADDRFSYLYTTNKKRTQPNNKSDPLNLSNHFYPPSHSHAPISTNKGLRSNIVDKFKRNFIRNIINNDNNNNNKSSQLPLNPTTSLASTSQQSPSHASEILIPFKLTDSIPRCSCLGSSICRSAVTPVGPLDYFMPYVLNYIIIDLPPRKTAAATDDTIMTTQSIDFVRDIAGISLWKILQDSFYPPTLKQLCRCRIRRYLNMTQECLVRTVNSTTSPFHIPDPLKQYLFRIPI